jgi:hypothetical protein
VLVKPHFVISKGVVARAQLFEISDVSLQVDYSILGKKAFQQE